jgi:putative chitinase
MTDPAAFKAALYRLWPNGDQKVPGLRAGSSPAPPAVFAKYGINSPLLISHVMAQISHECGAGHDVVENMNYTAADDRGLAEAVPDHRRAAALRRQPERRSANKVYNGRMGNASRLR